eukprot:TRINITY_DN13937_c0_g1_i1.p1 TRINITY_DN13937_c0_g1~~TRINITY_DN13937_c0_g1_i1.p1  ORF type:complete len:435 (+),score=72.68 TRINITY_DN13937_c0_g1_i1:192-1496(+)
MDFGTWREWTNVEITFYLVTVCDLQQYEDVLLKNISAFAIQELYPAGLLCKGLTRAGVSELAHQRLIQEAVSRLFTDTPEELNAFLHLKLTDQDLRGGRAPPADHTQIHVPTRPKPRLSVLARQKEVHCRFKANQCLTLTYTPRVSSSQQKMHLQPPDPVHASRQRLTPRLYDSKEVEGSEPNSGFNLRGALVGSTASYEGVLGLGSPLYGTVSCGARKTPGKFDGGFNRRPSVQNAGAAVLKDVSIPEKGLIYKEVSSNFKLQPGGMPALSRTLLPHTAPISTQMGEELRNELLGYEEGHLASRVLSEDYKQAKELAEGNTHGKDHITHYNEDRHAAGHALRGVQKIQEQRLKQKEHEQHAQAIEEGVEGEFDPWHRRDAADTLAAVLQTEAADQQQHSAATLIASAHRRKQAQKRVDVIRQEQKRASEIAAA